MNNTLKYNCIKGVWVSPNAALINNELKSIIPKGYVPWNFELGKEYFFEIDSYYPDYLVVSDFVLNQDLN